MGGKTIWVNKSKGIVIMKVRIVVASEGKAHIKGEEYTKDF